MVRYVRATFASYIILRDCYMVNFLSIVRSLLEAGADTT